MITGRKNMRILLTGGAGFIGSHTCVELLSSGHEAVIVDNLYNSSETVVNRIEKLSGKKVRFYQADVCDAAAMDRIFSENEIDVVIHFAAYKAVGESVAKPLAYYRNNLDCTLTVCETMKKHNVKRFIFSSSATVYGIPKSVPLNETTRHMINADAFAKMKSDALLVNTSRGAIIDEAQLIHALQYGTLGGACLDVYEDEPLAQDNPLRDLNRVILTPHTAGLPDGVKYHKKRYAFFAQNIEKVLRNELPECRINELSN